MMSHISLDTWLAGVHSKPVDTSEIPSGCDTLWRADAVGVDPETQMARAVQTAVRTGRPQAIRLPGGETVVVLAPPQAA